ncbi:MAG: hypothetical protein ACRD29_21820 [Acidimicrobiales bacterium]
MSSPSEWNTGDTSARACIFVDPESLPPPLAAWVEVGATDHR